MGIINLFIITITAIITIYVIADIVLPLLLGGEVLTVWKHFFNKTKK